MSLYASSGQVYMQQFTFDTVYYASLDGREKFQISRTRYNAMGEPAILHLEYRLPKLSDVKTS